MAMSVSVRKAIVGVMGPGEGAREEDITCAEELGRLIAAQGWITLSGGRKAGVMDAVSRGAKQAGGIVIGVLPGETAEGASQYIDIAVVTGMGSGRNNINVLTSDVVIACGVGAGTASEAALAIKAQKKVVFIGANEDTRMFFRRLGGSLTLFADTPEKAVSLARDIIDRVRNP